MARVIEEHPLQHFLDNQLPQMIAQAREAEKNRLHEIDVLEKKQEIGEKNFLLETQTKRGLDELDALNTKIETEETALKAMDIIPSQWGLLKDEDRRVE